MPIAPPIDMLPNDGIVAEYKGVVVGAVFMWLATNSTVSFIGFPIIDVDYLEEERADLLDNLFDKAETIATYLGFHYSFHYSGLPYMTEFLKKKGYIVGDDNVVNLVKKLQN